MTLRWDDSLSSEQRAAASHHGSNARILAGPGTGKSYTIARHIAYLVQERNVSADEVLILTFTRNATRSLRMDIQRELAPFTDKMPYISTLHGFSLRQLRRNSHLINSLPQPLRIADDWEEKEIINKDLVRISGIDSTRVKNGFKNLSSDWETLNYDDVGWINTVPDAGFIGAWEEQRRIYGYLLRSELVYQLKKALEENPHFLIEPNFKHLIIDEYQDLNPCDLAIVSASEAKGMTVLAVGDDDQSIYGFRNADPQGIRDFPITYPGSADLPITICRRCDEEILEHALWVAEQDHARLPKELKALEGRTGGEVRLLRFHDDRDERVSIARAIAKLIADGVPPQEILVLLRSDQHSKMSKPLIEELTNRSIPVATSIESNPVLELAEGRRALAILHLCLNAEDSLAWRTVLELSRGIGPQTIRAVYESAKEQGVTFGQAVNSPESFISEVPTGQRSKLLQSIEEVSRIVSEYVLKRDSIIEESGGLGSDDLAKLVDTVISQSVSEDEKRNIIQTYFSDSIEKSHSDDLSSMFAFLAVDYPIQDADVEESNVNVMTMHQAKGLTASVVFIVAAEDEIFPRSLINREMIDDRRLLYVSMTRRVTSSLLHTVIVAEGSSSILVEIQETRLGP